MAKNRRQVSYGSQGGEVTELQKLLNKKGYGLKEDGIFGNKTQAAVKDYQQNNNLDVDGIVGDNTWGSLTNETTTDKVTTTESSTETADPGFQYDAYQESDLVKQAYAQLQQQMANKPGQYQSAWQAQLNDVIGKIMNREKFTYDLNGDALYQQYKDQYTNQGKMAMMDTMGQAAAMTGGYGNSYAQSVGQQVYQGYMQELNSKIPELYQLALNKYQMEGDELYNQYSLLGTQEQQDYGRYRDTVSDWNAELDRAQSQYNAERDYDYGKWADSRDFDYGTWVDNRDFNYGKSVDDRNYNYQVERDQVLDSQWEREFNEAIRQFNITNAELLEDSGGGSSSGGGGGGSSGGSGGDYDYGDDDDDDGGGGGGSTTTANVHTAEGQRELSSQINSEINAAYKSGQITAAEAQQLKAELNPKGLTK